MPQYLGNSIETVTQGGKLFTTIGDKLTEVVYATNADLAKLPYDLAEGKWLLFCLHLSKSIWIDPDISVCGLKIFSCILIFW